MLIAYLDEFGHSGAYVDWTHKSFKQHPLFGYGGFIIPATSVRGFGARFERAKERVFASEIEAAGAHPRRWEKKGNELFTAGAYGSSGRTTKRLMYSLARALHDGGGKFFFYGEKKPVGSEKATKVTAIERTSNTLVSAISRVSEYANHKDQDVLILLDGVGTRERNEAITRMAGFMYSQTSPSWVQRLLEVPVQVESIRYGSMQFADWYCALVSRATTARFTSNRTFDWAVPLLRSVSLDYGATVRESRLWLPDTKKKITLRTLTESSEQMTLPTPKPSHVRVSTRIGEEAPELAAFYATLKKT